jgi:hypothetical protein
MQRLLGQKPSRIAHAEGLHTLFKSLSEAEEAVTRSESEAAAHREIYHNVGVSNSITRSESETNKENVTRSHSESDSNKESVIRSESESNKESVIRSESESNKENVTPNEHQGDDVSDEHPDISDEHNEHHQNLHHAVNLMGASGDLDHIDSILAAVDKITGGGPGSSTSRGEAISGAESQGLSVRSGGSQSNLSSRGQKAGRSKSESSLPSYMRHTTAHAHKKTDASHVSSTHLHPAHASSHQVMPPTSGTIL